ncbi:hypothetical protein [Nonomuraea zeae]|uniref:hypothetical protein n=1 Tax=Nonomuraea zeae TaxID=1642303 RepID=UPI001478242D|nr:hypothetical protein [Nonomuraea zeae]
MTAPDAVSDLAPRLYDLVSVVSAHQKVKTAVEANHDNSQWWPQHVDDWRVRMLVAGRSTRAYAGAAAAAGADRAGVGRTAGGAIDHALGGSREPEFAAATDPQTPRQGRQDDAAGLGRG